MVAVVVVAAAAAAAAVGVVVVAVFAHVEDVAFLTGEFALEREPARLFLLSPPSPKGCG